MQNVPTKEVRRAPRRKTRRRLPSTRPDLLGLSSATRRWGPPQIVIARLATGCTVLAVQTPLQSVINADARSGYCYDLIPVTCEPTCDIHCACIKLEHRIRRDL